MNKKGQLDEINPIYVLLSVIGGIIAWFVAGRASEGRALPIVTGIIGMVLCYIYLMMTDN